MRALVLAFVCLAAACPRAGGTYVQGDRQGGDVDRGETNGRRFDFVSNKPEEDDWQIRVTGSAMWVSFARDAKADKLGSINLTAKETRKLWRLIDALDIPHRKPGKKDEDAGYVTLQLKEPRTDEGGDGGDGGDGDSGGSEVHRIYISRATKDEDLLALAIYLQDLTEKYKQERPSF